MERLAAYDFDWVIPGHGERIHLPKEEMKSDLEKLLVYMNAVG
jgi:hypothetical protein